MRPCPVRDQGLRIRADLQAADRRIPADLRAAALPYPWAEDLQAADLHIPPDPRPPFPWAADLRVADPLAEVLQAADLRTHRLPFGAAGLRAEDPADASAAELRVADLRMDLPAAGHRSLPAADQPSPAVDQEADLPADSNLAAPIRALPASDHPLAVERPSTSPSSRVLRAELRARPSAAAWSDPLGTTARARARTR